jgi:hypothetical protein
MLAGAVKIVSADGDVIVTDGGRFAVVLVVFFREEVSSALPLRPVIRIGWNLEIIGAKLKESQGTKKQ